MINSRYFKRLLIDQAANIKQHMHLSLLMTNQISGITAMVFSVS